MTGRTLSIALIVSLALNAFLISAGGALLALTHPGLFTQPARPPILRAASTSLDPERRAAFLDLLRTRGRAVRPANREARALRQKAWGSLQDATFDAAGAKLLLGQARELNQASRATVENAVVDFAAALPAPERSALGAALRKSTAENADRKFRIPRRR